MKVLIAEGHQGIRESLSSSLSRHGVQVVGVAADGLEAIEKARRLMPDFVLLDVHIPRCSGFPAARIIGAEMPPVKIILLTTWDDEAYQAEAARIGAIACLPKTVATRCLISAMGGEERLEGVVAR